MHVGLETLKVHDPKHRHRNLMTKDEQKHVVKYRQAVRKTHRFVSLVSALLLPFIVLFSIPGLTEQWYVAKDEGGTKVGVQPDPSFVIICGAITLAFSILGDFFLLLRLLETDPRFCTFTGLLFLLGVVIIDTVALAIFGFRAHTQSDGYSLSTAFAVTATADAIAFIVILMFILDGSMTNGFRQGGTGLSGKQRSLVISFHVFMATVCIGGVVNKYLGQLDTFTDAIYFVIQTVITTGFGDLAPVNTGGRIFGIFFDTWGILTFAVVVAFTRATALEAMQNEYKFRERVIMKRIRTRRERRHTSTLSGSAGYNSEDVDSWHRRLFRRIGVGSVKEHEEDEQERREDEAGEDDENHQVTLPEKDYERAILDLKKERGREFRSQLVVSFLCFAGCWVVGAAVYMKLEGWNFFISFWFVYVSFSTIGYGDYSPQTQAGRAFFSAFALVGAGATTVFFSVLADTYSARFKETFQRSWFRRVLLRMHGKGKQEVKDIIREEERQAGMKPGAGVLPEPETEGAKIAEQNAEAKNKLEKEDPELAERKEKSDHLIAMVSGMRELLNGLILHDEGGASEDQMSNIDRVARQIMDDQNFGPKTRIEVMSDENMKRFLYLRKMQAELDKLEDAISKDSGVEGYDGFLQNSVSREGAELQQIPSGSRNSGDTVVNK